MLHGAGGTYLQVVPSAVVIASPSKPLLRGEEVTVRSVCLGLGLYAVTREGVPSLEAKTSPLVCLQHRKWE